MSVSVLVEVFFDDVFVDVFVDVVSVFVEVDVFTGISVSVTGGLFTVDVEEIVSVDVSVGFWVEEVEDDEPPPSVDWVFRVTVTGAGAVRSICVDPAAKSEIVREIFTLEAELFFTSNGMVSVEADATGTTAIPFTLYVPVEFPAAVFETTIAPAE